MEEVDNFETSKGISDEELLMKEVVQGEVELLYLDTYLSELFGRRRFVFFADGALRFEKITIFASVLTKHASGRGGNPHRRS